jgi:hypothetical protein
MTMRTYRYFICPNGHRGEEKTSENDQPYSASWESVTATGMKELGSDSQGYAAYVCSTCGQPMTETKGK